MQVSYRKISNVFKDTLIVTYNSFNSVRNCLLNYELVVRQLLHNGLNCLASIELGLLFLMELVKRLNR